MVDDSIEHARRLAEGAVARDDATSWFEDLYAAAEGGTTTVPWDRAQPQTLLTGWTGDRRIEGRGRRALVVGSGLGVDAEHVASLGFSTVAFDVSPTAIEMTRRRFPDSTVDYVAADVLDPAAEWVGAFDLVVESLTVQSLPRDLHPRAIAAVASTVAPGGTLLVVASADHGDEPPDRPPWPLTPDEIAAFAVGGLRMVSIEDLREPDDPRAGRWRAELRRDGA